MKEKMRMYLYLTKPIVNKTLSRLVVGFIFSLVWNHFSNQYGIAGIVKSIFFLIGIFLLTMGWFNYLHLDGIKLLKGRKGNRKNKTGTLRKTSIIDYLEDEVSDEKLEDFDESLSSLVANILSGLCFLLPALLLSYLGN